MSLLNLCSDMDQRVMVCKLLQRFQFLTSSDAKPHLARMVKQIAQGWGLSEDNTQIVAVTFDDEGDSGQAILQYLKPQFSICGWQQVWTVNAVPKSVRHLSKYPNVVLVDEFAGTGATIKKRVRDVVNDYRNAQATGNFRGDFKIRVCLLASMSSAIDAVEQDGIPIFAAIRLKKGISDYLSGSELETARRGMLELEAKLHPEWNNRSLPSFGYGAAESLFSTDGNAPNSVFPVFWWPRLRSGRSRKTVLHRRERVASA